MKKLAKALMYIGFTVFFLAMCADSEYLIYQLLIFAAMLFGILSIVLGAYINDGWVSEEDDDFELEDRRDGIEYDQRTRSRHKEKVLPPTKVTEPIQENK